MYYFLFLLFLVPRFALAQAQVFPTRVTLSEDAPSSYLTLRNPSALPQKFKIELYQLVMKKDGTVASVDDDKNPLLDLIKFSPKSIEIQPNDKQVVRVMVTSFAELSEGDHYIYLHFVPEGDVVPATNGSKFNLQAKIAVAIPLIVRRGVPKLDVQLLHPSAEIDSQGNLKVQSQIQNSTAYIVTGDFEITGMSSKGDVSLVKVTSLSSYIPERLISFDLTQSDLRAKLGSEVLSKIKIKYASNADSASSFNLEKEMPVSIKAASSKKGKKKSSSKRQ